MEFVSGVYSQSLGTIHLIAEGEVKLLQELYQVQLPFPTQAALPWPV